MPKEMVNHPDHYGGADNPYEAIKVIDAWDLGFGLGNVVKYILRSDKKEKKLEDLKKARWYLDHCIQQLDTHLKMISDDPKAIDATTASLDAFCYNGSRIRMSDIRRLVLVPHWIRKVAGIDTGRYHHYKNGPGCNAICGAASIPDKYRKILVACEEMPTPEWAREMLCTACVLELFEISERKAKESHATV